MKNVSVVKSTTKCESPKTPGGISKSLLTPCRRVGLSRNWKKSGPSPFISPLAGESSVKTPGTTPVATEKHPSKRKKRILAVADDNTEETNVKSDTIEESEVVEPTSNSERNNDEWAIVSTPSSAVQILRRQKSKKLHEQTPKEVDKRQSTNETIGVPAKVLHKENTEELKTESLPSKAKLLDETLETVVENTEMQAELTPVSQPVRKKSIKQVKKKSPNNLTKECIVVLQKKMAGKNILIEETAEEKTPKIPSQTLFDSDSDDTPLSSIKKVPEPTENRKRPAIQDEEDDDFAQAKPVKVKKLEDKKTSTGDLKNKTDKKNSKTLKSQNKEVRLPITQSSNSFDEQDDDDDDFDFSKKKTILIRKSYDKVSKPTKCKTTGSITQSDIDEIKARINAKKNMLLTKVLTQDTEELRGLIKKWRKGCQDALTELIELMRSKFPDRQNMDYSEILQTLRIPAALVGYDSDNDCFISPDDANIVLSRFQ